MTEEDKPVFVDDDEIVQTKAEPVVEQPAPKPAPVQQKASEDLTKRFYDVDLPSKGKLGYPATIEYRDIMVRDEKILATATPANYIRTLNKILKSLLNNPDWFQELTLADRDYLLMYLWANNYNTKQTLEGECDECTKKYTMEVDLTKVDVDDISDEIQNPFFFETSNGHRIGVRLLTINDQELADAYIKDHPEADYETVIFSSAIEVPFIMTFEQKLKWIEDNIRGKDMAYVRAYTDYFKYGLHDMLDHACDSCGAVQKVRLDIDPAFFRPSALESDFRDLLRANSSS